MSSKDMMQEFLSRRSDSADQAPKTGIAYQRVIDLLDADSFVSLGSQIQSLAPAASGRTGVAGEGLVSGYGQIDGRLVFVSSQDQAVYHGGVGQANAAKFIRTIELAIQAASPLIVIYDSGGLRVDEGLMAMDAVGAMYQALLEARELIPVIALVPGPAPGVLSILPAASDFVIMAEDGGGIYLQGPGITAAEEDPTKSPADIGGAAVHAKASGLASLTAKTSDDMLSLSRKLLTYLPDHVGGFLWTESISDDPNRTEERLDRLAENMDSGYEIADIVSDVFDHDSILELYADYATEIYGGLATLGAQPVLFIANKKPLMGLLSATKIESLLTLANRLNYPVISFTDTSGFISGFASEAQNITAVAGRIMKAFTESAVTRINIIIGEAIGQGYLVFNSKATGADLVYAWPTAAIGVLRPDSAVNLFLTDELKRSEDPITARKTLEAEYRKQEMSARMAESTGAIDEEIRPAATRPRIYSALQILEGL